jgi:hypothetical protein
MLLPKIFPFGQLSREIAPTSSRKDEPETSFIVLLLIDTGVEFNTSIPLNLEFPLSELMLTLETTKDGQSLPYIAEESNELDVS